MLDRDRQRQESLEDSDERLSWPFRVSNTDSTICRISFSCFALRRFASRARGRDGCAQVCGASGTGTCRAMKVAVVIVIVAAIVVFTVGFLLIAKRRGEANKEKLRREASDTRELAAASRLEADRQSAEAEERAARAKREMIAAEQQRLAATQGHSTAQELQAHAEEIDPDVQKP